MTFNKFIAYFSVLTLVHINSIDLRKGKKTTKYWNSFILLPVKVITRASTLSIKEKKDFYL
jgi:hypothetical protein